MFSLSKFSDFIGDSLFKDIKEVVMGYFPPDMSPQQKAEVEIKLQKLLHKKEVEANKLLSEVTQQLDNRIAEQEGTASDLKSIPILGNIMLFLRGLQRPTWGFLTMWMDVQWFFGSYTFTDKQQTDMIVINALVLGFLFGERTIKNLEPLIIKIFPRSDKT